MLEKEKKEGLRYNEGKTRHDLVPAFAQEQYAKVLTKGAEKYAERNWENGMNWSKIISSLKRHVLAIDSGEDYDKETGLLHSAHVMCNAAFLTEYYKIYPQGDDRPLRNQLKISLDIDEVLANWLEEWCKYWNIEKPIDSWYFDRNIQSKFDELLDKNELENFYLSLKPLINPKDIHFEPHCYITSRPINSKITELWLDMHGFPARPVYTVGLNQSKAEVFKQSGADIHVDDRYENMVDLANEGIFCYLLTKPWNESYNVGHRRINSLNELEYKLK